MTAAEQWRNSRTRGLLTSVATVGCLLAAGPATADDGTCVKPPRATKLSASERAAMLAVHNQARAAVGNPPLKWSKRLAAFAQGWANLTAKRDRGHSPGYCYQKRNRPDGQYGENMSMNSQRNAKLAAEQWLSEKQYYSGKGGRCSGGVCGHYVTMVAYYLTEVGCGGAGEHFVCAYGPTHTWTGAEPYQKLVPKHLRRVKKGQRFVVDGRCSTITKVVGGMYAHYQWSERGRSGSGEISVQKLGAPCRGGASKTAPADRHASGRKAASVKVGGHYAYQGRCVTVTGLTSTNAHWKWRQGRSSASGSVPKSELGKACSPPK